MRSLLLAYRLFFKFMIKFLALFENERTRSKSIVSELRKRIGHLFIIDGNATAQNQLFGFAVGFCKSCFDQQREHADGFFFLIFLR